LWLNTERDYSAALAALVAAFAARFSAITSVIVRAVSVTCTVPPFFGDQSFCRAAEPGRDNRQAFGQFATR
jgi:hypothetical protein